MTKNMIDLHNGARAVVQAFSGLKPKDHEITWRQMAVLARLVLVPGVSVRDLEHSLKMQKPVVTRSTAALVRHGYATKEPSKEDARLVVVKPTAAGAAFLRRVTEKLRG